jgi:hypothetical protein
MKRLVMLLAGLALFGFSTVVQAEVSLVLGAKISEAKHQNAALMHQYSWESRTELTDNGKMEDIRLEQNTYGPNGQVERSLINDQSSPLPGGFIRKKIAEHKREKVEKYIKGLRALLDKYTLTTAGTAMDFIRNATVMPADANGWLQITGGSVVMPGDTLSLWVSQKTHKPEKVKVMTFYEGNEVNVTVTYRTLASGLAYPAYNQVDVLGKGLRLTVQNFNYINQNN